jgi:hypothetical protein
MAGQIWGNVLMMLPLNTINRTAQIGEELLNFDVSDDGLERASGFNEERAMTWVYGTGIAGNCGCPVIE